jgi:hypothetical protein
MGKLSHHSHNCGKVESGLPEIQEARRIDTLRQFNIINPMSNYTVYTEEQVEKILNPPAPLKNAEKEIERYIEASKPKPEAPVQIVIVKGGFATTCLAVFLALCMFGLLCLIFSVLVGSVGLFLL